MVGSKFIKIPLGSVVILDAALGLLIQEAGIPLPGLSTIRSSGYKNL